jgi:hypothetical protein
MYRFPARHEVQEFAGFASLLRMATKYGFSNVRDQLIGDIRGAYPTKWEDFRSARVLGEDTFGSPKPHPNAVLNLFEAESLRFAIPFAAYRASIGGVSTLMSEKPGACLPRRALATSIQGWHTLLFIFSDASRLATYERYLRVCPEKACALNVGIRPVEERIKVLEKIYLAMVEQREGGVLSPPAMGNLLCVSCAKSVEVNHATWGSAVWERLPLVFVVSNGWDDLRS